MNMTRPQSEGLTIDFMFLDLQTCGRCLGTEDALDAAVLLVRPALDVLGLPVEVNKILIESEAHAAQLGFLSSPTIRIRGRDIAGEAKESRCGACGDVCGEEMDCRVWSWRGQEHTAAPVGLIVEAFLEAAIAPDREGESLTSTEVPENLKRFFAGKAHRAEAEFSADPVEQEPAASPCCDPAGSACGCS